MSTSTHTPTHTQPSTFLQASSQRIESSSVRKGLTFCFFAYRYFSPGRARARDIDEQFVPSAFTSSPFIPSTSCRVQGLYTVETREGKLPACLAYRAGGAIFSPLHGQGAMSASGAGADDSIVQSRIHDHAGHIFQRARSERRSQV